MVSVGGVEAGGRRRRRTPEVAQAEIIAAAEALLRERPFRELTVDEVMRRTELSRPSFYVYFKDRHDLVLRVVEHLTTALFTPSTTWLEGSGPELAAEALKAVIRVYAEHGPVMRALADAAADDPDVEAAYLALIQTFIDAISEHIRNEIERGVIKDLDAQETAKALIWMGERYLYLTLGREPFQPVEKVSGVLQAIWLRTLYGTD